MSNANKNSDTLTPEQIQEMLAEAKAMRDEAVGALAQMKEMNENVVSPTSTGPDSEVAAILAGIKRNEEHMQEKVNLYVDKDSLNRSDRYLFAGIGSQHIKIERGKDVKVSRAMRDSILASIAQQETAQRIMDETSEEWDPDAWTKGVS